jgi:DnaK suppressor protein
VSVKAKPKAKAPAAKPAKATTSPARKKAAAASSGASEELSAKDSELRLILEELRQKTLREIKEKVKSGTEATMKEIGDMYDQASEERDRELDLLLGDRERGKLLQIDEAFARLREGTYGICEECGEPINPKRMRIVPFTRTCVDCQTDKEHEERIMRDRDIEPERVYTVIAGDAPTSGSEDED